MKLDIGGEETFEVGIDLGPPVSSRPHEGKVSAVSGQLK